MYIYIYYIYILFIYIYNTVCIYIYINMLYIYIYIYIYFRVFQENNLFLFHDFSRCFMTCDTQMQNKNMNYLVGGRLMVDGEQGSDDDVTGYVCHNPAFGLGGVGLVRPRPHGQRQQQPGQHGGASGQQISGSSRSVTGSRSSRPHASGPWRALAARGSGF